jgi:hypothetical protein
MFALPGIARKSNLSKSQKNRAENLKLAPPYKEIKAFSF